MRAGGRGTYPSSATMSDRGPFQTAANFFFQAGAAFRYLPSMVLFRERVARRGIGAIEPCLPSPAKEPPSGPGWIHEIKHDGFRLIARRDAAGVRLITRKGNDFTKRFPLIAIAVAGLPVRSCLIDGEAIVCDESGLAVFELIRRERSSGVAVHCAFDLLEFDRVVDLDGVPDGYRAMNERQALNFMIRP
jgi:ATP dependent DNA ligase domain